VEDRTTRNQRSKCITLNKQAGVHNPILYVYVVQYVYIDCFNAILRDIVFTQLTCTAEIVSCITQMWLLHELQCMEPLYNGHSE